MSIFSTDLLVRVYKNRNSVCIFRVSILWGTCLFLRVYSCLFMSIRVYSCLFVSIFACLFVSIRVYFSVRRVYFPLHAVGLFHIPSMHKQSYRVPEAYAKQG